MFYCPKCGEVFRDFRYRCEKCDSVVLVDYEDKSWEPEGSGVWRYQSMIPVKRSVSMGEGSTPMVKRRDVRESIYMKLEGDNPTGSFKDRGTTVVLSDAMKRGFRRVTVASTGNMGASVSAYSAYANLEAKIFVPEDVSEEKILQMKAYNANLIRLPGDFSDIVNRSIEEAEKGAYLASTGLNPYFIEGLKTTGLEIFEQVGVPDWIVVPTGTGGHLTAIYKAFKELKELGVLGKLPRMVAVQARTCSSIVDAWENESEILPAENPDTIASAIKVKVPFNGYTALDSIKSSKGRGVVVDDHEILQAMKDLGKEGVFAEPSSAASLAALPKIDMRSDDRVVLVITGSGLKDPEAIRME
ncbi:MAG TPA: threonine synthase [Methanomassiliicoccales archaeon]|nr:threonine synthase [Methanomassiliicoccales archaeon]